MKYGYAYKEEGICNTEHKYTEKEIIAMEKKEQGTDSLNIGIEGEDGNQYQLNFDNDKLEKVECLI